MSTLTNADMQLVVIAGGLGITIGVFIASMGAMIVALIITLLHLL